MLFKRRTKINKDMIQAIRPTSKATLKMQCMMICNGDVAKAKELYDFYIQDMDELPMFDPMQPTAMQQVKDGAVQTFAWLNENQQTIVNWVGFFKGLFNSQAVSAAPAAPPVPPING